MLLVLLYVASKRSASDATAVGSVSAAKVPPEFSFLTESAAAAKDLAPASSSLTENTPIQPALAILPAHVQISQDWSAMAARPTRADWDFSGTGIRESDLSSYLSPRAPHAVAYFDKNGVFRYIKNPNLSELHVADTLFVSELQHIRELAEARQKEADRPATAQTATAQTADAEQTQQEQQTAPEKKLPENAFEVVEFIPGRRDDGRTLQPVAADLQAALQGPDYSLAPFNWRNPEEMRAHLSRILSFGHGGELILKISGDGYLKNENGFDFALYENSFRTESGLTVIQEFAKVGVAEHREGPYVWFPCDPSRNVLRGCLGAVPSSEGGDQFDLAAIGVTRARYLRIQDIGINHNQTSEWPTEGCDLDAVRLHHAYTEN